MLLFLFAVFSIPITAVTSIPETTKIVHTTLPTLTNTNSLSPIKSKIIHDTLIPKGHRCKKWCKLGLLVVLPKFVTIPLGYMVYKYLPNGSTKTFLSNSFTYPTKLIKSIFIRS